MTTPRELVASIERLAALPAAYHRIRELLADPDSELAAFSAAVSSDPAIAARVLQVANSALYGFTGGVATVPRAVALLGMQRIHDLVLAGAMLEAFSTLRRGPLALGPFWRDSVLRGLVARAGARLLQVADPERLFVQGLLADIGHLVMFQVVPELAVEAAELAARDGLPLADAESRVVGCHFAEVGAALADAWRLPAGFSATLGAQLQPELAGTLAREAALLALANRVVAQPDDAAVLDALGVWTASLLELDAAAIGRLRAEADAAHAPLCAQLFGSAPA